MSSTVDVNVLVYASNAEAPERDRAVALLEHLADGPSLVVLLWPVLVGYLRVVTHPAVFASPLSYADAAGNLDRLLERPHVRTGGEVEGFWEAFRHTSDPVAPRGNLVPDAHLAALMAQHGVTRIWSRDRDLRRFDGAVVVDPFGERFRDGFGGSRKR